VDTWFDLDKFKKTIPIPDRRRAHLAQILDSNPKSISSLIRPKAIGVNTASRKNGVAFRDGILRMTQVQKWSGGRRTLRPDKYSISDRGKRPRTGDQHYRHCWRMHMFHQVGLALEPAQTRECTYPLV